MAAIIHTKDGVNPCISNNIPYGHTFHFAWVSSCLALSGVLYSFELKGTLGVEDPSKW